MMVKDYLFLIISNLLGRGFGAGRVPTNYKRFSVSATGILMQVLPLLSVWHTHMSRAKGCCPVIREMEQVITAVAHEVFLNPNSFEADPDLKSGPLHVRLINF